MTLMKHGKNESTVRIDISRSFTVEDLRKLIGSVQDDRNWQIVITYGGIAYLCEHDEADKRVAREYSRQHRNARVGERILEELKQVSIHDEERLRQRSDLIYIRFETYGRGNGYVGKGASADQEFVLQVYQELKESALPWARRL